MKARYVPPFSLVATCILVLVACLRPAAAEELQMNLRAALELAHRESRAIRAAQYGEEKAAISVKRARAQRYLPEAELSVATGLVPEARGSAVDSPDERDDLDSLGPFIRLELEVVQPLYTFGRLETLERAARQALSAAEAKTALTREEISQLTIETYWALSSSRKALEVAEELRENFYKLIDEVQARLEDENTEVDDGDLLEIRSSTYQIEKTYLDSVENVRRASLALRILTGMEEGKEPAPADEPSPELSIDQARFEARLEERGIANSQVELLEAAAAALDSKIELQKRDRFPVVFIAAGAGFAQAPNRDDQTNPFVVDEFNYTSLGAEVGMRWKPNLYKKNLEVEELEKEHAALLENLAALRRKLHVQAADRFGEAVKSRSLLEAARVSLNASKTWLRLSLDNWELGIGEVKRLLDAYEAFYRMKGTEIEMELQYNRSLARIAGAIGSYELYLEWLRDGEIRY